MDKADMPCELIDVLKHAERVMVFTGAGVSAESGISTFRSADDGLWSRFDPRKLATPQAYRTRPDLVWGWCEWRRATMLRAAPNPGHLAIAEMAAMVPKLLVVTQNVDNLHERAGSRGVLHLHGEMHKARCQSCSLPYRHPKVIPEIRGGLTSVAPPKCSQCGWNVRPGVVWFGEQLPRRIWDRAEELARTCDVLFCVGTSAMVHPAAQLPKLAKAHRAIVVQVNPEETPLDAESYFNLRGPAGQVMPAVLTALKSSTQ